MLKIYNIYCNFQINKYYPIKYTMLNYLLNLAKILIIILYPYFFYNFYLMP